VAVVLLNAFTKFDEYSISVAIIVAARSKATGNSRFETEKFPPPPLSEKFSKIPVVYQA